MSRVQKLALPRLRDAFGPITRKKLWENDISARTFGDGFRTIEFVGAAFAANRNIKSFNTEIWETLTILRFTRVRYKWFDQAEKYTYFDIKPPKDGDLMIWENGAFAEVD